MDKNFVSEEALVEQGVTTNQQVPNPNQQLGDPNAMGVSTEDVTKALYGINSTDPTTAGTSNAQQQAAGNVPGAPQPQSEEQRLKAIRDKLHMEQHTREYYKPTFERPKQEEAVAEKLEREDEEKKMEDLQKDQKKESIALERAQTKAETNRGAAG